MRGQGLVVVLIGLIVFFQAKSEFFLTRENFEVIATSAAGLGIMAVAQTLLVVSRGIDISVGGVVALCSVKFDPLVTTLGTLSITQGLAYVISATNTMILRQPDYSTLGTGHMTGVPIPVVLVALVLAIGLTVERVTPTGRKIYAIGGNLEAARPSGVRIDRIRWVLYGLSGASAALAGAIITAQLGAGAGSTARATRRRSRPG